MEEAAPRFVRAFGAAKLNGQELKERFHFYPTNNTAIATTQWAPLERGNGAHFVADRDDSGGSSFNTQNDVDSPEDQTCWLGRGGGCPEEADPTETQGLELLSLLASCADSITHANIVAVDYFLCRLGELASPRGPPIHRLAAYFAEALALRAATIWPHVFTVHPPIDDTDDGTALRILDRVTPIPKFIHFSLNAKLLEAFRGKERVHIIDLDVKEGLQWPGLLQSLAAMPNPPAHVRITGIGDSRQELNDTAACLKAIADSLSLRFEFHPVVDKLEDVRLWMLHVKEHECVAVNCVLQLHKVLDDDDGNRTGLTGLLGLIRSTNPAVVAVAEEEAEHNDPRWEMRFANALRYYSAAFDAVHSSGLPEDSASRVRVEEALGARIRDVVACEGRERVERHERFERWREMMGGGGFGCVGFGEGEEMQCRMLLRMYSSGGEEYSIGRMSGMESMTLKFMDQPLYTVSAWAPTRFEDSCTTAASLID